MTARLALSAALLLAACTAPGGGIPDLVRGGLPPGIPDSAVFQARDTCWYYRDAAGNAVLATDANGIQVCTETG